LSLSDYNLAFPTWEVTYKGSTYNSLESWLGLGFDSHSLNNDPLFVNRTIHDYHLQAGSPAKNAGRVSGTGDGAVISMGAYSTGTEVIGPISAGNPPAAPTGLTVQ